MNIQDLVTNTIKDVQRTQDLIIKNECKHDQVTVELDDDRHYATCVCGKNMNQTYDWAAFYTKPRPAVFKGEL